MLKRLLMALGYSVGIVYLMRLIPDAEGVNWIRSGMMGLLLLPAVALSISHRDRALACCVGAAGFAYTVSVITNLIDPGYIAHGIATWCGVMVMCSLHHRWHLSVFSAPLIVYNLVLYRLYGSHAPSGADPYHIGNLLYILWCIASVAVITKKQDRRDGATEAQIDQIRRAA